METMEKRERKRENGRIMTLMRISAIYRNTQNEDEHVSSISRFHFPNH